MSKAVSSVVAMFLILAIISLSISVILANYAPMVKRNAEIKLNMELREEFMRVSTAYSDSNREELHGMLNFGGEKTPFGALFGEITTTSTLSVNKTGNIFLSLACNGSAFSWNISIFSLELKIYNSFLPEEKLVLSNGGIKIFQSERNFTKVKPSIELKHENNTVLIRVDTLLSKAKEVSGNGIVHLKLSSSNNEMLYENCTGFIQVNDTYFDEHWIQKMRKSGLNFEEENRKILFENKDVSLLLREFKIDFT